jgi:hypothetical protein
MGIMRRARSLHAVVIGVHGKCMPCKLGQSGIQLAFRMHARCGGRKLAATLAAWCCLVPLGCPASIDKVTMRFCVQLREARGHILQPSTTSSVRSDARLMSAPPPTPSDKRELAAALQAQRERVRCFCQEHVRMWHMPAQCQAVAGVSLARIVLWVLCLRPCCRAVLMCVGWLSTASSNLLVDLQDDTAPCNAACRRSKQRRTCGL